MNHRSIIRMAALLATTGLALSVHAKPFTQFIEFSGALSDNGNYATQHGDSPAPFYKNRTTNGLVAGELLASRMGLQALPSNHLKGKPVGTNFAVRDALAGANGPHDLPNQIQAYLAPNKGKADPDAFYFVFNGGNDVIMAVMTPDDKAADAILDKAVKGLEDGLHTLIKAGARTIMAPNFIDVGVVPAVRAAKASERASRLSAAYNQRFEAMLQRVEAQTKVRFIRWDFDAFLKDLLRRGDEFGFTNLTDPCVALMAKGECQPDRFIYLNETFPTARVHQLMAEAMALAVLERDRATK
jgi:phospholipase/lecithinase/hemolysin